MFRKTKDPQAGDIGILKEEKIVLNGNPIPAGSIAGITQKENLRYMRFVNTEHWSAMGGAFIDTDPSKFDFYTLREGEPKIKAGDIVQIVDGDLAGRYGIVRYELDGSPSRPEKLWKVASSREESGSPRVRELPESCLIPQVMTPKEVSE